ncbi:hypothetical protein B0J12DRAFT_64558 [Macrophomina phaseolina]|uniref:Secreted protein n=1 Tax=Macrophomina phaseolina TaxID=35725 RepID=A0ABQ8GCQ2_9PEZI|nr:hypothetical protein B0J12DRAFT_64558 [Macrophomina phaseolina]
MLLGMHIQQPRKLQHDLSLLLLLLTGNGRRAQTDNGSWGPTLGDRCATVGIGVKRQTRWPDHEPREQLLPPETMATEAAVMQTG